MLGSLLRNSVYARAINWNDLLTLATASADSNDLLQQEFVSLVTVAKDLYTDKKKKKRRSRDD
jgi:hypothetical protein